MAKYFRSRVFVLVYVIIPRVTEYISVRQIVRLITDLWVEWATRNYFRSVNVYTCDRIRRIWQAMPHYIFIRFVLICNNTI